MAEERAMRSCQKTACRWPAAASLSYRYDTRQVWLLDLSEDPDPSLYDLCPHHADTLVVMRGWARVDQRTHADPVVEPAGRDLLPTSGRPPVGPGGYGGNRYTELVEDLPRLAALLADDEAAGEGRSAELGTEAAAEEADRGGQAEAAGDGERGGTEPEDASAAVRSVRPPIPSRDLAPVPAADPAQPSTPAAAGAGEGSPAAGPDAGSGAVQVPGQLAIPVATDDSEVGEAVVVSISEATSRRRTPVSR